MKNQAFHRQNSQGGNVMFVILIGIVLFAALSYTMSQNMRGNASMVTDERANLVATELLEYGAAMRNTVQGLRASGCNIFGGISFYSTQFANPAHYNMAGAPADKRCHVFDSNGGGINWRKPPEEAQAVGSSEYVYAGMLSVHNLGTNYSQYIPAEEHKAFELMMLAYVPREICLKINSKLGITNPSNEPPTAYPKTDIPPLNWQAYGPTHGGTGGFTNSSDFGNVDGIELRGKTSGCWQSTQDNSYHFYYVLVAR